MLVFGGKYLWMTAANTSTKGKNLLSRRQQLLLLWLPLPVLHHLLLLVLLAYYYYYFSFCCIIIGNGHVHTFQRKKSSSVAPTQTPVE